jgi:predicted PurR-regulated permease PerM
MKLTAYVLIFIVLILLSLYLFLVNENLKRLIAEQEKLLELQINQINTLRYKLFEQENPVTPDIVTDEYDV